LRSFHAVDTNFTQLGANNTVRPRKIDVSLACKSYSGAGEKAWIIKSGDQLNDFFFCNLKLKKERKCLVNWLLYHYHSRHKIRCSFKRFNTLFKISFMKLVIEIYKLHAIVKYTIALGTLIKDICDADKLHHLVKFKIERRDNWRMWRSSWPDHFFTFPWHWFPNSTREILNEERRHKKNLELYCVNLGPSVLSTRERWRSSKDSRTVS